MRGCLAGASVDNITHNGMHHYSFPSYHHHIAMSVRKSAPGTSTAMLKRARVDDDEEADPSMTTMTISSSGGQGVGKNALVKTVKRTSGLSAPIVSLAGAHQVSKSWLWEKRVRDAGIVVVWDQRLRRGNVRRCTGVAAMVDSRSR